MCGEPQRLCAMATTGIEGTSRRKVGSLGDQMRVRWTARDFVGLDREIDAFMTIPRLRPG